MFCSGKEQKFRQIHSICMPVCRDKAKGANVQLYGDGKHDPSVHFDGCTPSGVWRVPLCVFCPCCNTKCRAFPRLCLKWRFFGVLLLAKKGRFIECASEVKFKAFRSLCFR